MDNLLKKKNMKNMYKNDIGDIIPCKTCTTMMMYHSCPSIRSCKALTEWKNNEKIKT